MVEKLVQELDSCSSTPSKLPFPLQTIFGSPGIHPRKLREQVQSPGNEWEDKFLNMSIVPSIVDSSAERKSSLRSSPSFPSTSKQSFNKTASPKKIRFNLTETPTGKSKTLSHSQQPSFLSVGGKTPIMKDWNHPSLENLISRVVAIEKNSFEFELSYDLQIDLFFAILLRDQESAPKKIIVSHRNAKEDYYQPLFHWIIKKPIKQTLLKQFYNFERIPVMKYVCLSLFGIHSYSHPNLLSIEIKGTKFG
jgi:hypothetical protein